MSLFLDEPLEFEKAGSAAHLGENPDDWGPKIISELHKQVPFISKYDSRLEIDKLNPEQGYALGWIDVRNKSQRLPVDEVEGNPVKHARVPVIVRDFQLQQFDVFLRDKRAFPLTEDRFTEAMFRPEVFDIAKKSPPTAAMSGGLYPPGQNQGGNYGQSITEKTAQPRFLMDAIGPTLSRTDVDAVVEKLAADHDLAAAFMSNEAASGVLQMVGLEHQIEKTGASDMIDTLRRGLVPNVVQITKLANGNALFKWAQAANFDPQQEEVPPEQAQEMAGPEMEQLQPGQTATMSPTAEAKEMLLQEQPEPVTQFGEYKVTKLDDGNEVLGWVLPNLLRFTLEPTDMALFTNGSEFAVAPGILGSPVGRGANLPSGDPSGYGVWYFELGGKVAATVPVTVSTTQKNPDGTTTFLASDDEGQPVQFIVAPGLANISGIGEGQFAIPDHWKFMPLYGKIEVATVGAPLESQAAPPADEAPSPAPPSGAEAPPAESPPPTEQAVSKTAAARLLPYCCTVRCDRGADIYSLDAPAFEKVAEHVNFVDRDAAEFMLVCAGLSPSTARTKLAEAYDAPSGRAAFLAQLSTITPWEEKVAGAVASSYRFVGSLPDLKRDLLKEAAVVTDADTVDKMLALGFLTPENLKVFVDYLPALEDAVSKLADLLVAARVGLGKTLQEDALQKSMMTMDEVIQGLKELAQR